jgi:hypothetical protein
MVLSLKTDASRMLIQSCHTGQIETTGVFRQVPPWARRFKEYLLIGCDTAIRMFRQKVTLVTAGNHPGFRPNRLWPRV